MEVPLARPVAPGETVNVQITWSSRVPRTFARTGAIGDFYFVGQWFPKIGVLEDTGWNTHQFHSGTEFFADFGTYDVRLTVPKGWVVGATGVERERRDEPDGATTTHRYVQDDVHDFAWTTSPHFLDQHATFADAGLPPVDVRLLLQPEHAGQADRHFAAARATLKNYGQWFGPYPYGHLTIVDPAWQSDASGMEYATLITAGTRWLTPATPTGRKASSSTRPGTSSGRGWSRRTSSNTRGWTRASTPIRPRALPSRRSAAPTIRNATSATSSPGCFATCPAAVPSKATGCRPTAAVPRAIRPRPKPGGRIQELPEGSPTRRPRCGCTHSSEWSAGRCSSASCRPIFRGGHSDTRNRTTSLPLPAKSAAGI